MLGRHTAKHHQSLRMPILPRVDRQNIGRDKGERYAPNEGSSSPLRGSIRMSFDIAGIKAGAAREGVRGRALDVDAPRGLFARVWVNPFEGLWRAVL